MLINFPFFFKKSHFQNIKKPPESEDTSGFQMIYRVFNKTGDHNGNANRLQRANAQRKPAGIQNAPNAAAYINP